MLIFPKQHREMSMKDKMAVDALIGTTGFGAYFSVSLVNDVLGIAIALATLATIIVRLYIMVADRWGRK
jgi:hypothetical protein